jgi:hypothetical protein
VLTVLAHYGILEFNKRNAPLHVIISTLFPIVFRVDGRFFDNEFPAYKGGKLDNRLVSSNPHSIAGFLHRANLSTTVDKPESKAVTTLLPPPALQRLIASYGKELPAVTDFVRSGKGAEKLLREA